MALIDGIQYITKEHLCYECGGSGDYFEWEDGLDWYQGHCHDCDGNGVLEGYCGFCLQCESHTCNKSYGEYLCTEHDESRHIEIKNYPDRYERVLL